MSKKFNRGDPPSQGWWPTRYVTSIDLVVNEGKLRWWDGSRWSRSVACDETPTQAQVAADVKLHSNRKVEWAPARRAGLPTRGQHHDGRLWQPR